MSSEPQYWIMKDDKGHLRIYGIRNYFFPCIPVLWAGNDYKEALTEYSRLTKEKYKKQKSLFSTP